MSSYSRSSLIWLGIWFLSLQALLLPAPVVSMTDIYMPAITVCRPPVYQFFIIGFFIANFPVQLRGYIINPAFFQP